VAESGADLVAKLYEAFNRREFEALRPHAHPEIDWVPNPLDPEQDVRHGLDAMERGFEDLLSILSDLRIEVEKVTELGDNVIVCVRHVARGAQSGAETVRREVHVWTFRDRKAIRMAEYPDEESALSALGEGV
jgi:ketosteroid isomerase-like protein